MKRLSRNVLSITLSDIARRVFGFLAVAYLARRLGVADFGVINIGFTILAYGMVVSSAGLGSLGTRSIARGESGDLLNRIVSLRLIGSAGVFIIVVVLAWSLFADRILIALTTVFCFSLFANAVLLDWYFQGKERLELVGFARTTSAVIYFVLLVLFVQSPSGIVFVAIAAVVSDSAATFILWRAYKKEAVESRFRFDLSEWRSFARQSILLGGGTILGQISINLPTIILAVVVTTTDVGLYSAALKLVFFLLLLDRVAGTLLLPASARFYRQAPESLPMMLQMAAKWIILIALPLCVGGMVLADQIVPFVFGAGYLPAGDIFRVLIWYFFFTLLHTIYVSGLIAVGEERSFLKVMLMSTGIYAVATVGGVIAFGPIGAAVAMVLSEGLTVLMTRHALRRRIAIVVPRSAIGAVAGVVVMAGVLILTGPWHLFLSVLVGGTVYTAVIAATRSVTRADLVEVLRRV